MNEEADSNSDEALPIAVLTSVREAQRRWNRDRAGERVEVVQHFRRLLVEHADEFADRCAEVRKVDPSEVYPTEILPLADACRYLEQSAESVLKSRKVGGAGRPLWLRGVKSEVVREPHGIVLILAPSNYPLFLAGAQAVQALTAGNAVLMKPAPGAESVMELLGRLLATAGLPDPLFSILPSDPARVSGWIEGAADKVVLTGGGEAGRAVMRAAAEGLVPATLELSGVDSFHVLPDADLDQVVAALEFGLGLNGGRTCIAPRRIFVRSEVAEELRQRLQCLPLPENKTTLLPRVDEALQSDLQAGARILRGEVAEGGGISIPLVLEDVPRRSSFWREDHFAPVAIFQEVTGLADAIERDLECPFALGASIFSRNLEAAEDLARQLPAGAITINDVIAPTADPRLPFGGAKRSGFGVTRGEEGLLEMTRPKVIIKRRPSSWTPHLEPAGPNEREKFRALLQAAHGATWGIRWQGFQKLAASGRAGKGETKNEPGDS